MAMCCLESLVVGFCHIYNSNSWRSLQGFSMLRGRSAGGACMRAAWTLASSLSRRSQQHAEGSLLCWTWPSWYALSLWIEQHPDFHQITDEHCILLSRPYGVKGSILFPV